MRSAFPVIVAILMLAVPLVGSASQIWIQTDKITPEDADKPGLFDTPSHAYAKFGFSMDTDGERLIVSAPGIRSAYIFDLIEDEWEQTGKIQEDTRILSTVGSVDDVAIHGDLAIIGAPKESSDDTAYHGAAYLYEEKEPGHWEQVHRFEERPETAGHFGHSVAIGEETVVVGGNGMSPPAIFVYERDNQEWSLVKEFRPGTEYSSVGRTVAMEGDTILAADTMGDPRDPRAGSVYVLERTEGAWVESDILIPPDPIKSFGFDMDFDGTNIIVGAAFSDRLMGDEVHDTAAFGKAFIYERSATGWDMTADLDNPVPVPRDPFMASFGGELFGMGVAINGAIAVVGAPFATPQYSGAAYVYERGSASSLELDEGEWERSQRLIYDETYPGDRWGMSAAVVDDRVLVGAAFDNNRRDGTPYPVSTMSIPCCAFLTDGQSAGSVYEFQKSTLMQGTPSTSSGDI